MHCILIQLFCILCFVSAAAQTSQKGKIVGIHDGDTVTLLVKRTQYKIRLVDIDAPEIGQDFGTKSKQALVDKIHWKTVIVKTKGHDRYGRVLGAIYLGNVNINWWMIEHGWAHQYLKYNTSPQLAALQSKAKAKKLGIWAIPGTIPPWEYRAVKKKQHSIHKARKRGEHVTLEYWLNTSSNSRHNSTCKNFKNTKRGRPCKFIEGKACGICGG